MYELIGILYWINLSFGKQLCNTFLVILVRISPFFPFNLMGLIFSKTVKKQGCVQVYGLVKWMVSTAEAPEFYQSFGRKLLELLLVRYVAITHDADSSVPVCSQVLYEMNLGVHCPLTKQMIAYPYFSLRNDG